MSNLYRKVADFGYWVSALEDDIYDALANETPTEDEIAFINISIMSLQAKLNDISYMAKKLYGEEG